MKILLILLAAVLVAGCSGPPFETDYFLTPEGVCITITPDSTIAGAEITVENGIILVCY